MTEKESEKVKAKEKIRVEKRTGKLLSSFVVLTIVLSVLAVSVAPVSAQDFDGIIVSADPTSIPADGSSTSAITATLTQDGTPVGRGSILVVFKFEGEPKGATLSPSWDTTDGDGKAYTTLTAGIQSGLVTIKARTPGIPPGTPIVSNTTQVTLESIEPTYNVSLTVDQAERKTAPDVDATYLLTVENTGDMVDSYTLTRENPDGADVAELNRTTITNLAAGKTAGVLLNVTDADIGTYIVNVTVTGTGVSAKVTTKTNVSLDLPDLIVTEITPNCDYLFANESNNINATIKNNGTADAGAFNVSFVIDSFREEVRISGLAAGASTTRCVTDPTLRNAGDLVSINVTADCNGEISELNETDNWMNISKTVVNNGYKGKRYTGGEDIKTVQIDMYNGSILYSVGDSYYLSAYANPNWTTYNVSWNISDLPVPTNASVEKARLYVPYTWDKEGVMPGNVNLVFNGNAQILDAHYSDEKGWATSYPYGMLAYNVTADFNTSGNVANLTNLYPGGNNVSMRGMLLVVIYADESEPQRTIIINEGFDLLYGGSAQCTTPEEATAYAPFAWAIEDVVNKSARLITVAPGAGPNEGELIFNGNVWTDVWNFAGATEIGIDDRYVTSYLLAEDNEAAFQSSADYMEASIAILVVEEKLEKEFTIDFVTGYNMISMPLNDTSVTNASTLATKIGVNNCTKIAKWDRENQEYVSYIPGVPLNDFDTAGGDGYFVNVIDNTSVVFSGMGWESPFSISLVTGYNMIGIPVNDTSVTNASTLATKIGVNNCTKIAKWDRENQEYVSYIPGVPLNDFDTAGGDGYFVNMVNPTDVTFVGEPWHD